MNPTIKVLRPTKDFTTLKKAGIESIALCLNDRPYSLLLVINHDSRMFAPLDLNGRTLVDGHIELVCTKAQRVIEEKQLRDSLEEWHMLVLRIHGSNLASWMPGVLCNGEVFSSSSKDQQLIVFLPAVKSKKAIDRTGRLVAST